MNVNNIILYFKYSNKIIYFLFTVLVFQTGPLQAQTIEMGIGINKTHLWQQDGWLDGFHRKDKLGISLIARIQNPKRDLFINNNEIGLEYTRGEIKMVAHTSPGGAGGEATGIRYSNFSITLNNYFINFKTLTKGFQMALGLHLNYKIITQSDGYFSIPHRSWDSTRQSNYFFKNYYSLDGINNKYIRDFNFGICAGIGFREFKIGKWRVRTRYDITNSFLHEVKSYNYFYDFRQRFTLNFIWSTVKQPKA